MGLKVNFFKTASDSCPTGAFFKSFSSAALSENILWANSTQSANLKLESLSSWHNKEGGWQTAGKWAITSDRIHFEAALGKFIWQCSIWFYNMTGLYAESSSRCCKVHESILIMHLWIAANGIGGGAAAVWSERLRIWAIIRTIGEMTQFLL